ncbi:hypothetical protein E3Q01_02392 [Wallemia mellicola]|uniref:Uncharacterized protein n=1 Tax=Wallemia mellicola TaxID=1708541 RepID=A0A4T0TJJ7_9BASI|nr:hypothetical protein E3Q01_02392 [Wallemia mellicola]
MTEFNEEIENKKIDNEIDNEIDNVGKANTESLSTPQLDEQQELSNSPISTRKSLDNFDDAEEDFIKMNDKTVDSKVEDVTPVESVEEFDKRMSQIGLRTPPDSSIASDIDDLDNSARDRQKILEELANLRSENVALMTENEKLSESRSITQQELDDEKKARVDAEEIIVQLRTRVEESRNGVMKLQQQQQEQDKSRKRQETEQKRSSFILNEPANLSKRASIKSHKRLSSMSADNAKTNLKDFHLQPQQAPSSNRSSQIIDMTNLQMENANLSNELQRMKKEIDTLREAKLSSDNALRALREFMDSSGEDKPKGLKLPPLPTDEDVPTPTTAHKSSGSWFFGRQSSGHQPSSSNASSTHDQNTDGGFDKPSTLGSISSFFGKT